MVRFQRPAIGVKNRMVTPLFGYNVGTELVPPSPARMPVKEANMQHDLTPIEVDRFWKKVAVAGPDDCWPWQAAKAKKGYGTFWANRTSRVASRVSWELVHGPIPDGLWVLHRCDNPACVNPSHLFLGTALDNNRDMSEKGRSRGPIRPGELNPRAKLTWDQVREMRALRAAGGMTLVQIGERYGVAFTTVSDIVNGKRWVKDPDVRRSA